MSFRAFRLVEVKKPIKNLEYKKYAGLLLGIGKRGQKLLAFCSNLTY